LDVQNVRQEAEEYMTTTPAKPFIGLTCLSISSSDWVQNTPGKYLDAVFREYSRGVEFAGGIPVLIPVFKDLEAARAVLDRIDGLLLTGGRDVCPRFFGEEPIVGIGEMDYERDLIELEKPRPQTDQFMVVENLYSS
jgi:putative glutamine amidotransferase